MHKFIEDIKKNYEYEINKMILQDQEYFFNFICSGFISRSFLTQHNYQTPLNGIGGVIVPELKKDQKNLSYRTKASKLILKNSEFDPLCELIKKLSTKLNGLSFQLLQDYFDEEKSPFTSIILTSFYIIEKPSWKNFRSFMFSYIDQIWKKIDSSKEDQNRYEKFLSIVNKAFDNLTPSHIDPLTMNLKEIKGNEFSALHLISDYQKFMKFVKENYTDDNWKFFDQIENKNLDHDLRKFNCFIVLANSINFCGMSNYRGGQNVMLVKDGDVTKLNEVFYLQRERKNLNSFLKEVGIGPFLKHTGTPFILACKK